MLLGLFVPTPTLFTKTSYHLQSVCVPRPKPASLSLSILPSETCSLALIDAQNDTQNHSKPSTVASSYTFTEKFCNLSKYGNPKKAAKPIILLDESGFISQFLWRVITAFCCFFS